MKQAFGEWRFETTTEGRVRIACNGGDYECGMTDVAPSDADALAKLQQALGCAPDRAMRGGVVACAQAARKMIAEKLERASEPDHGKTLMTAERGTRTIFMDYFPTTGTYQICEDERVVVSTHDTIEAFAEFERRRDPARGVKICA